MPDIRIVETNVTPDSTGDVLRVRLRLADVPLKMIGEASVDFLLEADIEQTGHSPLAGIQVQLIRQALIRLQLQHDLLEKLA